MGRTAADAVTALRCALASANPVARAAAQDTAPLFLPLASQGKECKRRDSATGCGSYPVAHENRCLHDTDDVLAILKALFAGGPAARASLQRAVEQLQNDVTAAPKPAPPPSEAARPVPAKDASKVAAAADAAT